MQSVYGGFIGRRVTVVFNDGKDGVANVKTLIGTLVSEDEYSLLVVTDHAGTHVVGKGAVVRVKPRRDDSP